MLALIARKYSHVVSSVKLIVGLIHTQVNNVRQVYSMLTWHTFLGLSFSMTPLPTAAFGFLRAHHSHLDTLGHEEAYNMDPCSNAVDAMHGLFSAATFRQQSVKKDVIGPCQFDSHSGCMQ